MKKYLGILLAICMTFTLCACDAGAVATTETVELDSNEIQFYKVNTSTYQLVSEVYTLKPKTSDENQVKALIQELFDAKVNGEKVIDNCMRLDKVEYNPENNRVKLRVKVSDEYNDAYVGVLSRAAITRTLVQLSYVDYVQFNVYDPTIVQEDGSMYETIESYTAASFVDMDVEGAYVQKGVITLYFANETGDKLVKYEKGVEVTNNVSLPQLVIESLIEGPLREGYQPTIPENTGIRKISVKDGVCYVDLTKDFNNAIATAQNTVTIYSIVNSLCELPTVSKVQFLVEGEPQSFYRETIPMDGLFERNEELIVEGGE